MNDGWYMMCLWCRAASTELWVFLCSSAGQRSRSGCSAPCCGHRPGKGESNPNVFRQWFWPQHLCRTPCKWIHRACTFSACICIICTRETWSTTAYQRSEADNFFQKEQDLREGWLSETTLIFNTTEWKQRCRMCSYPKISSICRCLWDVLLFSTDSCPSWVSTD